LLAIFFRGAWQPSYASGGCTPIHPFATSLARDLGAELLIVHVEEPPAAYGGGGERGGSRGTAGKLPRHHLQDAAQHARQGLELQHLPAFAA
jgi:hypothetical protein